MTVRLINVCILLLLVTVIGHYVVETTNAFEKVYVTDYNRNTCRSGCQQFIFNRGYCNAVKLNVVVQSLQQTIFNS